MSISKCLNCGANLAGEFCSSCGQKANVGRITMKHFIVDELLYGVWRFEGGIFFTVKEALLKPGYSAKEYIAGKRNKYYNVFYLMLMVLAAILLIIHFSGGEEILEKGIASKGSAKFSAFMHFVGYYIKLFLVGIIPMFALNSFVLFRKLNYNYAEHLVLAGFTLLSMMVLVLLSAVSMLFPGKFPDVFSSVLFYVSLLFPLYSYYQVSVQCYTTLGYLWRIIVFLIFQLVQTVLIILFFRVFTFWQ